MTVPLALGQSFSPHHMTGVNFLAQDAMGLVRTVLAIAVGVFAMWGGVAEAQKQSKPPKRPIIINDRSIFQPPPPPHERTYMGPGPSIAPPMERLPQVPPLAQPPIR
ncbi:MAG: hypothetical protein K2X43_03620 [Hyphomonadaceae bacterium]|nr:hypothetical protein [Hyphomonadaceae bacterium]